MRPADLTYDQKIEMLRLADDLAGGEVSDLDTAKASIVISALRMAAGGDDVDPAWPRD